MRLYFHKIFKLLGSDVNNLPKFLFLFLFLSILDLVGIGLIGPYIAVVSDPQFLDSNTAQQMNNWVELPTKIEPLIAIFSLIIFIIFLVKTALSILINYIIIVFGVNQQTRIRSVLMSSYQSLPYITYLQRNSAEYIYSTQTLVGHYVKVLVIVIRALSDIMIMIAIFILLVWTNILAFLLLVIMFGVVVFLYHGIFQKKVAGYGTQSNIASTTMVKGIHESIDGLKEVRILGAEKYFFDQVIDGAKKYGYNHVKSTVIATAPRYLLEFSMVVFVILMVLFTLGQQQNFQNLLPTLGIFGLSAVRLLPVINRLSVAKVQFDLFRNSVDMLYQDVNDNIQQPVSDINKHKTYKPFNKLSINNISFRYPGLDQNAINSITFDINSGDSIGFIGPSGSGKTTLIDLLLGLLTPKSGEITFNGEALRGGALKKWQSHIAYLPQQVFLTDSTLKENIALGVDYKNIDSQRLASALDKARLVDLISQLPKGVDTLIGERGFRLSGGQRQRIALARAFYHERDVLVMDESTSALDDHTEQEVVKEIYRFKGQKTIIVIAHRISSIQGCDKIYKIDNGRVVKIGKPEDFVN